MKNKGSEHKHRGGISAIWNCKGTISHITRPIESMPSNGYAEGRFDKKKWSKRRRGYFKNEKYFMKFEGEQF